MWGMPKYLAELLAVGGRAEERLYGCWGMTGEMGIE